MESPAWQVRVDREGAVEGAGFLVSARHVLTCAHVVQYADRFTVTFPGRPHLPPLGARVAVRGPWAGESRDPGDVAVLELNEPSDVRPAEFAPLDEAHGGLPGSVPKLISYGFPDGYPEGVLSELRVTSRLLIRNEWTQVEDWKGYGQRLAPGFSGAAAALEAGGAVVGMISSSDPDTGNGRMISARTLGLYWPEAAELIPTPGYSAAEKRRLRLLVARLPELQHRVDRLMRAAVGQLGVEPPGAVPVTVWEAVWFLLSQAPPRRGAVPLAEFTVRLADLVEDTSLGRELREWSRDHRALFDTPARPAAAPPGSVPVAANRWSPILVEIRRSGADRNALLVEVSAFRDGSRRLIGEKRLLKAQIRDWVLDRIEAAFGELDIQGEALIAFALPRGWLNQPVDQWARRRGDRKPLGCVLPVVVIDHDRRANELLQYKLRKMWDVLDSRDQCEVRRIACDSAEQADRLSVQLQDVYGPVGFARPPKTPRDKELHRAALDAPAPILLWSRSGCVGGTQCAESCQGSGFLDALAEQLATLPPGELPHHVHELRKQAFLHEGNEPHWAAELSLVWEDPRCFPPVRLINQSPVA
ncbi:trypsin-like peptidase domain-containing protein [Streptomyces sp. NPDC029004]|uniref:VMAP-C domain-containing protein n=1 Tax=Streptomyces sp. NPDC029004 TaxID=3154490 RepID=UPI0033D4CBEE